jgi:hypothetical protein
MGCDSKNHTPFVFLNSTFIFFSYYYSNYRLYVTVFKLGDEKETFTGFTSFLRI